MSTSTRRVRRVRLAAPHHDLVRRGQVLLEDALHTASIPAADGGRLVLVRALDVGRIHPHAPPSTLALAIEARLREVQLTAVHADDPAAPAARAVYFRDAAEAYALLAARLAAGASADAWFWTAAVPGWRPGMAAEEGMRLALRGAAESPQGAAAVAEVLRTVATRGGADRLLSATLTTIVPALLRACGWTAAGPVDADAPDPVPSAWRPLLSRWVAAWGADDARSLWLAATVLVAERPSRVADRTLPSRAAALVRAVVSATLTTIDPPAESADPPPAPHPSPSPESLRAAPRPESAALDAATSETAPAPDAIAADHPPSSSIERPRSGSADDEPHARGVDDDPHPPISPPDPSIAAEPASARPADAPGEAESHSQRGEQRRSGDDEQPAEVGPADLHRPEAPRPADAPRRRERAVQPELVPTEAGGLFFLVSAMARLGMADAVDRHPALLEADLPGRVLLRVAERTRVPPDDSAVRCLEDARDAGETGARYAFQAPAVWARAAHAREAPPAWEDAPLEPIVEAWVAALRRFCRRHARIGLWDVVRRPGRMAFTRTHVDVTFALRGADVRIRAAGLDVDPGWVPWLGRVVAYHYAD